MRGKLGWVQSLGAPRPCQTPGSEGTGAPLSSDSRHLPSLGLSLLVREMGSLCRAATGALRRKSQGPAGSRCAYVLALTAFTRRQC